MYRCMAKLDTKWMMILVLTGKRDNIENNVWLAMLILAKEKVS